MITQGTDTHQYLNSPLRRGKILKAISRSAAVICRSGDLGRRLREAGAPPEKLRTVYNGVDLDIFQRRDRSAARAALGIAPDDAVLLFVGNLLPVKNPGMLVAALHQLNQARAIRGLRGAILNIIGTGPMERQLRHQAETLGLDGSIHFLGRQAPADVSQHMNAADVLCLASWNEGFPNVVLEAMACGLPVVSTDVGGIRERIDRPTRGLLVPAGEVPDFVAALNATLERGERVPQTEIPGDLSWAAAASAYADVLSPFGEGRKCHDPRG
ncbi:MAG: Glycosyltransferase involved in cell wall bisynthesis [Verrucomicrobia bacterium]|nr:MAG: Glycosyltransferase involved in cell wall bisynthesis [Verrucomicrobiota bacterium]